MEGVELAGLRIGACVPQCEAADRLHVGVSVGEATCREMPAQRCDTGVRVSQDQLAFIRGFGDCVCDEVSFRVQRVQLRRPVAHGRGWRRQWPP